MFQTVRLPIATLTVICFLTIGLAQPAVALTQVQIACNAVNNWPSDYVQAWPMAVKKHNASPNSVTAASYMVGYIEIQKAAFKIVDPTALFIYKVYEHYWSVLEEDYIYGNGKLPSKPSSLKVLTPMMKACAKFKS